MATFSEKNKMSLFVGVPGTAKTTGNISTLTSGEIGIFNRSKTTRLTEAAAVAGGEFTLVEGKGAKTPFTSDVISGADVVKVTRAVAAPATEKVDYIGYNTTSGAIEAINDNLYFVRLHIDQSITNSQGGGILVKHGQYKSDATATQVEVADGLVSSFINNFSREASKYIKFERVTNSTFTSNTTGNLTVVNGSKYVTAATDIDNGGSVAGDYMRIGGIAYKVVAYNVGGAEVAELDIPYQGPSNAALAGAGFYSAANAAAGDWGIKLTGLPLKFSVGKFNYRKAKWVTTLQGAGTTAVTEAVGANPGVGTYEQAAELEFFYKGNDGEYFRMGEPNIFPAPVVTDPTATYDAIVIEVVEGGEGDVTVNKRKKQYMLLIPNATPNWANGSTADDITDVLEDICEGKPVYGGAVTASGGPLATGDLAL